MKKGLTRAFQVSKYLILFIVISFCCNACIFERQFTDEQIKRLSSFFGVYQNQAINNKDERYRNICLSEFIWPSKMYSLHSKIHELEFRLSGKSRVKVRAFDKSNKEIKMEKNIFVAGKDFFVIGNKIELKRKVSMARSGQLWAGMNLDRVIINLDSVDNPNINSKNTKIGLLLCIAPFVDNYTDNYKFKKLKK